jgi:DNA-binding Lrp family transcriptional regulator
MSIQAIGSGIDLQGFPDMTPTRKLCLLMLCNAHNGHTGDCFPSQSRLAKEVGVSEGTIQRSLAWLEKQNLIKRFTVHLGQGRGSKTTYRLDFLHLSNSQVQTFRPITGAGLDPSLVQGVYKDDPESKPEDVCGGASAGSLSAWFDGLWAEAERFARPGAIRSALQDVRKYVVGIEPKTVWVNARFIIDKHGDTIAPLLKTRGQALKFHEQSGRTGGAQS